MFFIVSTFFLFYFLFFKAEIVLSIPFRKLTKAAIKTYFAKYICFQFDQLYKILQSSKNICQYPGKLLTLFQRYC